MEAGQPGTPVPSNMPFCSFPKTRLAIPEYQTRGRIFHGAYAAGKLLKYPLSVKLARLGRADEE
jgi:hypothetical protein